MTVPAGSLKNLDEPLMWFSVQGATTVMQNLKGQVLNLSTQLTQCETNVLQNS